MEQYRLLAECLLPGHMLDWFDLKNVRVEKKRSMPNPHTFTGDPLFPAKTLSLYKKNANNRRKNDTAAKNNGKKYLLLQTFLNQIQQ